MLGEKLQSGGQNVSMDGQIHANQTSQLTMLGMPALMLYTCEQLGQTIAPSWTWSCKDGSEASQATDHAAPSCTTSPLAAHDGASEAAPRQASRRL
jgi:hypothetical protein